MKNKTLTGIFITCGGVQAVGDILDEYEQRNIRLICYENYPEILKQLQDSIITATLDSGIEEQGRKSIEVKLLTQLPQHGLYVLYESPCKT